MDIKNNPIGFFDSGVGGLSVLKETLNVLPYENFIYFGDSENAPYGIKSAAEIKRLTFNAVDFLLKYNVKALVVACNTATSVCIEDVRKAYKNIPIIGIEPAVKPAVELHHEGSIIIMATPMALSEGKFMKLLSKFSATSEIHPVPCPELVEFVESGIFSGPDLESYLKEKLEPYKNKKISCIVLGCTHFPFIKDTLSKLVMSDTYIIDGSLGTANHLKHKLIENNLLSLKDSYGWVKVHNSKNNSQIIDLSYKLLGITNDRIYRRDII
ncbi:glutamate racemase [Clostridium oryzae]|uniref:glutamate racemase n=1 Tax=Clostridium oryzae TaxID=1450648 RepID=UPI0009A4DCFF|nr:glutamate racemase [Clostridium oryzae]